MPPTPAASSRSTTRADDRTYYPTLEVGMAAFGLHDLAAQQVVLSWAKDYKRTMLDPGRTWDDLVAQRAVRFWTAPSSTYLAVGHTYDTAIDNPLDGYLIAARIYRNRIEITGRGGGLETRLFPGSDFARRDRSRVRSDTVALCPTCFTTLPASGVCDTCS